MLRQKAARVKAKPQSHLLPSDPIFSVLEGVPTIVVWAAALLVHVVLYIIVGVLSMRLHGGNPQMQLITDPGELVNGISVWVVFVPTIYAYYRWLPQRALLMAKQLEDDDLVRKHTSAEHTCCLYKELQKVFDARWLQALALAFVAICLLVFELYVIPVQELNLGQINFWYFTPGAHLVFIFLCMGVSYMLFVLALRALGMIYVIHLFFRQPNAVIRLYPLHPDHCGGFGMIGHLCIRIGLIVVLIATWATVFSLYPTLSGGHAQWGTTIIVYIIYLIIAPLVLFFPLWEPHLAMQRYKHERLKKVSDKLLSIQNKYMKDVDEEDISGLNLNIAASKELSEVYRDLDEKLPTWPISVGSLRKFSAVASSPILVGVASLIFDVLSVDWRNLP